MSIVECSYCPDPAPYMGSGQDGDLYCEVHKSRAWNGVILVTED